MLLSVTAGQRVKGEALLCVTHLFLSSTIPALKRLSLGLVYLVGYTLLSPHITENYLLTEDYDVSGCQHTTVTSASPNGIREK